MSMIHKDVRTEIKNDCKVIHLNLYENEQKPDYRTDLRPNGFTRESVFHDCPIRGQEVLLHVRRRRWLDNGMHNIVETCFPNAMRTLNRFHHQQFYLEALQEVRREHRRVHRSTSAPNNKKGWQGN